MLDLREKNKCMKEQMETKIIILYHEYIFNWLKDNIFPFQIELEKQKEGIKANLVATFISNPSYFLCLPLFLLYLYLFLKQANKIVCFM